MQESAEQIVKQARAVAEAVAAIVGQAAALVQMEADAEAGGGGGLQEATACGQQAERYEKAAGLLEELAYQCRDLRADLQSKAQGYRLEQSDYLRAFSERRQ